VSSFDIELLLRPVHGQRFDYVAAPRTFDALVGFIAVDVSRAVVPAEVLVLVPSKRETRAGEDGLFDEVHHVLPSDDHAMV